MPATPTEANAADRLGLVKKVKLFEQYVQLLHLVINVVFSLPGHKVAKIGVFLPWIAMENVRYCHQEAMPCQMISIQPAGAGPL